MQIPADMHKWRTKFVWQMIGFAVLLLLLAGQAAYEAWFFRAKFLADPLKFLIPTAGLAFGVAAAIWVACMCISVVVITRRHGAKIKELEKNRPPLTLAKLREDLQPESQEKTRSALLRMLRSSPSMEASMEARMKQIVEQYRTDLGSSPEVETELAKLKAFNTDLLAQVASTTAQR